MASFCSSENSFPFVKLSQTSYAWILTFWALWMKSRLSLIVLGSIHNFKRSFVYVTWLLLCQQPLHPHPLQGHCVFCPHKLQRIIFKYYLKILSYCFLFFYSLRPSVFSSQLSSQRIANYIPSPGQWVEMFKALRFHSLLVENRQFSLHLPKNIISLSGASIFV